MDLVRDIVDFFTAKAIDSTKYDAIKQVCIKSSPNKSFYEIGLLSSNDYLLYIGETKTINGIKKEQVSISSAILETVLRLMNDKQIINNLFGPSERYMVNEELAKYLYDGDWLLNYILGFNYIAEKYSKSVFKIEHIDKNDDPSIGTGFLFNFTKHNESIINSIIITNKHVVEGAKIINLFDSTDEQITYKEIIQSKNIDVAAIILNKPIILPSFNLGLELEVLSEIITIGYPSIPMTREAYQVFHKGEINSNVEDYRGNKLFLFSAKTSSGNSGGPIIDEMGRILGIVTQDLFEEELLLKKGKPPYYAGIPSEQIRNFLNEFISTV